MSINLYKKYLIAFCLVITSVFIGSIALMVVYALPTGPMFRHAQNSIESYNREGDYPYWSKGKSLSSKIDNFTDSIMIRKAVFPGTNNIVNDAMLNPSINYKGTHPVEYNGTMNSDQLLKF